MSTRTKGTQAEDMAVEYLIGNCYEIVTRNYTVWGNEIDIIALQNNELVFVEVKSIVKQNYISIYELLDKQKVALLYRAVEIYLSREQPIQPSWRLDFIGIELNRHHELIHIEHLKRIGAY